MKRPVWRYSQEASTNAPLEVVRAKLEGLDSALLLSVCAPRLGGSGPRTWRQDGFEAVSQSDGWLLRRWTARMGALHEEASLSVRAAGLGCLIKVEGKLKGWPLLWKVGLLGWRSEGLLKRFIMSLSGSELRSP